MPWYSNIQSTLQGKHARQRLDRDWVQLEAGWKSAALPGAYVSDLEKEA